MEFYSNNKILPLDMLLDGLVEKFNPENAKDLDITYQFIFKEYKEPVYLIVKNQAARLLPKFQTPEKVDTILTTTHETWQKICFKQLSGKKALLLGMIKCKGSLKNFASIPKIFDKEI